MINKYNNSNKKIRLDDFNSLIDMHNRLEKSPSEDIIKKVETLPAEIVINDSKSILVKQFNWQRNGVDNCWAISNNYSNQIEIYNLDDTYTQITFDASDFTSCPDNYSGYSGIVYIGACLSNCSSTTNNTSIDDMLDGTVVQLSNPRVSPNKIHLLKMPIESYNNSSSNVNTSFMDYDGTIKVIGAVKLDINGDIVDTYQYHTGNIIDSYKTHPFEIFIFNKTGVKVNNGNITDNITTYSYVSEDWDTSDYDSFSSGTNYLYIYESDGSLLLYSSTTQNEYPNYYLIGTIEYDGSRITSIIQNQNQDIITGSVEVNEDPTYKTSLVDDQMGSDTSNTDTWTYGDVDGDDNLLGCYLYTVTRVEYDPYGEKQINIFGRLIKITTGGKIHSVGDEYKYSIPTVSHSDI